MSDYSVTIVNENYDLTVTNPSPIDVVQVGTVGPPGPTGPGVASGGTTGQILSKASNTNYDTTWINPPSGAVWGSITGTLSNQTDLQSSLNSKQNVLTIGDIFSSGGSGISVSGGTGSVIGSGVSISQTESSSSTNGYLSSTDWSTFNNKFTLPSLTSGSVLFSNGTTISQNNSKFFWENTNGQLFLGYNALPTGLTTTSGFRQYFFGETIANVVGMLSYASGSTGNAFNFYRANGTFNATPTVTTTNQEFLLWQCLGFNGASFQTGAQLKFTCPETWASGDIPVTFEINTAPNGSSTRRARYQVDIDGNVKLNGDGFGNVVAGSGSTNTAKFVVRSTTEQLRIEYDASNYMTATIGSSGSAVFDLIGTSPTFEFDKALTVSGKLKAATTGSDPVSFIYGGPNSTNYFLRSVYTSSAIYITSAGIDPSYIPLKVVGATSQTAALQLWSSSSADLISIKETGKINFISASLVSTSATSGAQSLPANPDGFIIVQVAGVDKKIPYYQS